MQDVTYRDEDLSGLHQIALLCQHSSHTIGSIDVVRVLAQYSTEVLQCFEEAVVDLLQGLCCLGVTPAAGITSLGSMLVHMKLPGFQIQHSLEQQGVGIVLTRGQLQYLVDIFLGFVKVLSVQVQLTCMQ